MKPQLKPYRVRYEKVNKKGEVETIEKVVEATCPGGALRSIHKKYPAAKLLGALDVQGIELGSQKGKTDSV